MATPNFEGPIVIVDQDGDLILEAGKEALTETEDQYHGIVVDEITQIRVSSKVMTLSSPVFKAMLTGNFREGQLELSHDNPPLLELPGDAPGPLALLCKVLHHHAEATEPVSFVDMHRVALISDKYLCNIAMAGWFHRQLHLRPREISIEDLAYGLNASYLFDDKEAFYLFSQAATEYLPKAKKESPLAKTLLPFMQTKLIDSMSALRSAKMRDLEIICQCTLGKIFQGPNVFSGSTRIVIIALDETRLELPKICSGQANRAGKFIASLHAVKLWRVDPTWEPTLSLCESAHLLRMIANTLWMDDELCDLDSECDSCTSFWAETFVAKLDAFSASIPGICLPCLKMSTSSAGLATTCCHQLQEPQASYWRLAGYDTWVMP